MTPAAILAIAERQRRLERIEAAAFDKQRAFVRDDSLSQYLLCPRRAGKSRGGALKLFRTAERRPGSEQRYVGLTRMTAKDIMWGPLKEVARDLDLGARFNETELRVTMPNGSSFRLIGMDANQEELHKALGGKLAGVLLDEAASFRVDVEALVRDYIGPATLDQGGWIALAGTPRIDEARGYFYRVTTGKAGGVWSAHTWDTADNPHMRSQWLAALDRILREDPLYMETPEFRCMYKAEWPDSPSGWVYQFNRERNLIDLGDLPEIHHRVIGIDLGWKDDTAIVDMGWNRHDKRIFVLHAEKASKMHIEDIVARVRAVEAMVHGATVRRVVDGANQQVVQEMRKRYGLVAQDTDKADKAGHIRMMNTELLTGRVMCVRGWVDDKQQARGATPLIVEWSGADETGVALKDSTPLVWDRRAMQHRPPRLIEDSRCANHACFVAGTMVATTEGDLPIECVAAGDVVRVRDGWATVSAAGRTDANAPVWEMRTKLGRVLRGTPNHPVFTVEKGWQPLAELTPGLTLIAWGSTESPSVLYSTASTSAGIPTRHNEACVSTSRLNADETYTAQYGKLRMARSPQGTTSTTRTKTHSITPSTISRPSRASSTSASTCATPTALRCPYVDSLPPATPPASGTAPPRVWSGIHATADTRGRSVPSTTAGALFVGETSGQRSPAPKSAAASATPSGDAMPVSTTWTETASIALVCSGSTGTPGSGAALDRVLRVTDTRSSAPVFNLTVAGQPEYFANGVLVHNCDSALYAWRHAWNYMGRNETARVIPGTEEWAARERARNRAKVMAKAREAERR